MWIDPKIYKTYTWKVAARKHIAGIKECLKEMWEILACHYCKLQYGRNISINIFKKSRHSSKQNS